MIKITPSTIVYSNDIDVDCHVVFRSKQTGFEFNSFYIKSNSVKRLELEYYLYPFDCNVFVHYVKNNEYQSEIIKHISINSYSIINDIGYSETDMLKLIDTLKGYNKCVYKEEMSTHPNYRLSKIKEIFYPSQQYVSNYFLSDYKTNKTFKVY